MEGILTVIDKIVEVVVLSSLTALSLAILAMGFYAFVKIASDIIKDDWD